MNLIGKLIVSLSLVGSIYGIIQISKACTLLAHGLSYDRSPAFGTHFLQDDLNLLNSGCTVLALGLVNLFGVSIFLRLRGK